MTSAYQPSRPTFWHGAGSVAFRLALVTALLGTGLTQLSLAIRFPRARPIAYADIARQQPEDGWYEITGATLDYDDAVDEYLVPTRGSGLMRHHLYEVHDWVSRRVAGPRARVHMTTDVPLDDPSGKVIVVVERLEPSLRLGRERRTVEGTIAAVSDGDTYGARLPGEYRRRLAAYRVVVAEGGRPHLGWGIPLTAFGTLFGFWSLLDLRTWWRRRGGVPGL